MQMLSGASEIRLGSLHPRRDFTFVEDTVDGFIRIARADVNRGTTIQLGTGTSVSIGEVVELCRDITGSSAVVTEDDARIRPATSEVQVLLSDPTRAGEVLGWSPRTDLRSGLDHLTSWLDGRDTSESHRYHR
jgi:UDP-glucose 4-epimerase